MTAEREGPVNVNLGATEQIGLQMVADGRFENLSEARRADLLRVADNASIIDRLAQLGAEGMASGIDDTSDIGALIASTPDKR